LSGLLSAALPFDLRLRVRRFDLTLNDRLSLGQAVRQFRPDMTLVMEDPFEAKRRLLVRGILEGWQSAIGGWRISLDLSLLESRADPAPIFSVAESLLFGAASQEAPPATSEIGIVDLSASVPLHYPLPHLIMPSFEALRHLGVAGHCNPPQVKSQNSLPAEGLRLGQNAASRQVSVSRSDLRRHMLMIGATGVGKSTLLKQMIRQDLDAGFPLLLVDPHGDLCSDARALLPASGPLAPIVLDLATGKPTFGLDLLNPSDPDRARSANLAANELAQVFQKVLYHDSPEGFGPMWSAYWKNAVLLMQLSEGDWNLTDLDRVFHDSVFRRTLLQSCSDPMVVRFWTGIAMKAGGEASLENITPYIISKLSALTGSATIRSMIDGTLPKLDLAGAFDQGRPVLVNLAKGSLGAADAMLVGALVTAELMRVLIARCAQPRSSRKPARLYLDEFQTYATDTLAQLMAEGRKTGAEMILASQDVTSFGGSRYQPHVADAILSNVGNLLVFRTGPRDASLLADWFAPTFTPHDLMRLPDRTFAARLLQNGVPLEPMLVQTHREDGI
jgi:GTPase SAR1 family protein